MGPKVSVIVPTYNEEESIAYVINSMPSMENMELIVVDSSEDRTAEIAKSLGAKVVIEKERGKGRAMRTGANQATGDVIVFLDGDGTNPPQMIPDLVMELRDCGMVLGSRGAADFDEDDFLWRLYFLLHKVWIGPVFKLAGLNLKDPLTGFRAIRKKDWERLNLVSDHFDIETEINIIAHECGLRIKEIPVPNLKRYGGESKFITSTKDWGRIVKYVANYKKKKIKEKLRI